MDGLEGVAETAFGMCADSTAQRTRPPPVFELQRLSCGPAAGTETAQNRRRAGLQTDN